jgi:hypothetical protein
MRRYTLILVAALLLLASVGANAALQNYFMRNNTLVLGGTVSWGASASVSAATSWNLTTPIFKQLYDSAAYYTITQANAGAVTFNSVSDGTPGFWFVDALHLGDGYAGTGSSFSTAGVGQFKGALTTDGALTALSADIGGGYSSTGVTIDSTGAVTGASTALFDSTVTSGKVGSAGSVVAVGSVSGSIAITPIATGTAATTIQNQNVAAATITLPSATCTLPGLGLANIWSAAQELDSGFTVDDTNFIVDGTTGAVVTASSLTAASAAIGGGYSGGSGVDVGADGTVSASAAIKTDTSMTCATLLGKALTAYVDTDLSTCLGEGEYGKLILYSPDNTGAVYLHDTPAAAGTIMYLLLLTDQTITISTQTGADDLITNGNTTADSVSFDTSSHKVGSMVMITSDGSNWIVVNLGDTTMTVNDS